VILASLAAGLNRRLGVASVVRPESRLDLDALRQRDKRLTTDQRHALAALGAV
jgi:hypothetical protein